MSQYIAAGECRNAAHAGGHRGLADNMEQANLAAVAYMGTTAELGGEIAGLDHPHNVAVLLAKEHHRPQLLGLINGHLHALYRVGAHNKGVNQVLHFQQLIPSHGVKVGKVKAHFSLVHQLTGLLHMRAQYLAQGCLQ